jgi:hypothetical protein
VTPVLQCESVGQLNALRHLLGFYAIGVEQVPADSPVTASFWGDSEAGIAKAPALTLFVRADTPIHSALHEAAHIVCMSAGRREALFRDAGGNHAEENAVCYLQILWADLLPDMHRGRMMQDMDSWGYSFRLGSTRAWFERDATDAYEWLLDRQLINASAEPTGRLNTHLEP